MCPLERQAIAPEFGEQLTLDDVISGALVWAARGPEQSPQVGGLGEDTAGSQAPRQPSVTEAVSTWNTKIP